METETRVAPAPKAMFWAGWVVTAIPVLMMLGGGLAMLFMPGPVEEGLKKLDYPASHARGIIILEGVVNHTRAAIGLSDLFEEDGRKSNVLDVVESKLIEARQEIITTLNFQRTQASIKSRRGDR